MATPLRIQDPILLDSLIQFGAQATVRAVPVRKRYARALKIHPTRASRHRRGDVHSPSTHYLISLALAEGGSAWPMIAEGIAVVIQQTIQDAPIEQLQERLRELDDMKHDRDAAANRATLRVHDDESAETLEEAATADIAQAEIAMERSAIRREIAKRKRAR